MGLKQQLDSEQGKKSLVDMPCMLAAVARTLLLAIERGKSQIGPSQTDKDSACFFTSPYLGPILVSERATRWVGSPERKKVNCINTQKSHKKHYSPRLVNRYSIGPICM